MTVQAGSQSGMPRTCSERSYARFEQSSQRDAPKVGALPQCVHMKRFLRSRYRARLASYFAGRYLYSVTVQGPHSGAPSKVGAAHRVHNPLALRAA